jgi:TetR/AcrR family transcriptional repressor of nem operon
VPARLRKSARSRNRLLVRAKEDVAKDTRQKIVTTAASLIARNGYRGTSLDKVSRMSGVNRGSVYYFFKSKEELGIAVLGEIHRRILADLFGRTLDLPGSAKMRVKRLLKEIATRSLSTDGLSDCPLAHLAAAAVVCERELRVKFGVIWSDIRRRLSRVLAQGRLEGDLEPDADVEELAVMLLCMIQGAFLMARSSGDGGLVSKACAAAARQMPWTERRAVMSRS